LENLRLVTSSPTNLELEAGDLKFFNPAWIPAKPSSR
jgi:hypothetical protein